ncbi:MAG: peptidoglycan-associated lipoprotein Pal [Alphaproteobacteria bacterium]|nr:peptidoglycan-associated lipoprotein Pal [Candidatus Jidaibacter sp.]
MNIFKAAALGASLLLVTACSTMYGSDVNSETKASRDQIEELETKVGDRVFFELDSSSLNAEAQETLNKQVAFMGQNKELTFIIEGHCDERGTREYNIALGERRANSVKNYLRSMGVDTKKLTIISYGKEKPAVTGSNEWAWNQNRRAVTVAQ